MWTGITLRKMVHELKRGCFVIQKEKKEEGKEEKEEVEEKNDKGKMEEEEKEEEEDLVQEKRAETCFKLFPVTCFPSDDLRRILSPQNI